ncbi:hypothetical protein GDO81_005476 [Engystomops pustulosus]|uniref:Uncharacterized protein n=1 Tax=Engystomops pustulosus TaxID=76066 RepID=A0AAV7CRK2_ENGPU|nr:hypothetical protein GDO81_005476 [Engystomops pustulosus]
MSEMEESAQVSSPVWLHSFVSERRNLQCLKSWHALVFTRKKICKRTRAPGVLTILSWPFPAVFPQW